MKSLSTRKDHSLTVFIQIFTLLKKLLTILTKLLTDFLELFTIPMIMTKFK